MPQLNDPHFAKAVILLCEHGEDGAFGLVLNRRTEARASAVVQLQPPPASDSGLPVWIGGPVEPERGWILLGSKPTDVEAVRVSDDVYLSTSQDLLRRLLEDPAPPQTRLLTGYAGWSPGQLDAELSASAWLTAAADPDIIFDTQPDEMWEAVIRRLGADPTLLQMGGAAVH